MKNIHITYISHISKYVTYVQIICYFYLGNLRTKLRMKLLHIQKRDNVEFYLCCKFQLSPFSVRRKTDVKDGVTNKQTDKRTTVCLRPRHNKPKLPEWALIRMRLLDTPIL